MYVQKHVEIETKADNLLKLTDHFQDAENIYLVYLNKGNVNLIPLSHLLFRVEPVVHKGETLLNVLNNPDFYNNFNKNLMRSIIANICK